MAAGSGRGANIPGFLRCRGLVEHTPKDEMRAGGTNGNLCSGVLEEVRSQHRETHHVSRLPFPH